MKKIYHFLKCHSLCLSFSSCLTVEAIFFFLNGGCLKMAVCLNVKHCSRFRSSESLFLKRHRYVTRGSTAPQWMFRRCLIKSINDCLRLPVNCISHLVSATLRNARLHARRSKDTTFLRGGTF